MTMITSSIGYSCSGRKRKKAKAKGEVYKKLKVDRKNAPTYIPPQSYRRDEGVVYKSAPLGSSVACIAPEKKQYTGTLVKGISTMHKSNAVPVIDDQEIIDHARMRR